MTNALLSLNGKDLEEVLRGVLLFCQRPEVRNGVSWETLASTHLSFACSTEDLRMMMHWLVDLKMVTGYREWADGFSVQQVTDLGHWRLKNQPAPSMLKLVLTHATMATLFAVILYFT